MPIRQTSKPSRKEPVPGFPRLQKYVGSRKVSWYYLYPNGASETLASALLGDRQAMMEAEHTAKRKHSDIVQGVIVAGSVADLIERFKKDEAPTHYRDQSKDGIAVRAGAYANLTAFFGAMNPKALKQMHGYQYLQARAKANAPAKAIKEMALFNTVCHKAVEWGIIEVNPFIGMRKPKIDRKPSRVVSRSQVVQFYLWSQRQDKPQFKVLGCACLFTYLTGYRAAEVRPYHTAGISKEGVRVTGAKRKMGEDETVKLRYWSRKLATVVKRAKQLMGKDIGYLFSNRHGQPYTRSGWGAVWQDAFSAYLGCEVGEVAAHPEYFSLLDVRPVGISKKMEKRDADVYDYAGHGTRATTDRHYDRRKVKKASATE